MIRVLSLVDPREVLRRRVRSQPFCGRCATPLCMSRAVLAGEALVCGQCFEEMAEIPGSATVLDGRKLFERKAKGGKS
jgi:hypothetical protein